jgi:hypothetical protein
LIHEPAPEVRIGSLDCKLAGLLQPTPDLRVEVGLVLLVVGEGAVDLSQ